MKIVEFPMCDEFEVSIIRLLFTHTHTHTHARTHAHAHTHAHARTHARTHAHTHTHTHTHTHNIMLQTQAFYLTKLQDTISHGSLDLRPMIRCHFCTTPQPCFKNTLTYKITYSGLLVCGHAEEDHEDSAMDAPQSLLHLQWKVQLLIIAPGRSEVRGQSTPSQVKFVALSTVSSIVGSQDLFLSLHSLHQVCPLTSLVPRLSPRPDEK